MSSQNTRLLATLVAASALLGASNASSATGLQAEQRTISLRGLDPATPAAAYKLYREIVTAAHRVCGGTAGAASIAVRKARNDVERCRSQSISAAVQTVDAVFGLDLEQLAGVKRSSAPAVARVAAR